MKKYFTYITLLCSLALIFGGCVNPENTNDNRVNNDQNLNTEEVNEPISMEEYFRLNSASIELDENKYFDKLEYIDSDLENKEIFLTGEFHNVSANDDLRMAFLKYFKEKTD